MAVDDRDSVWIRNRDMIRLYAHQGPKSSVGLVNGQIAPSPPALIEKPYIAEDCQPRSRDVSYCMISDVW